MQNTLITLSNVLQGCKYCHDKFQRDYGPWTAFRTLDYGYTRVQVFNSSHLYLEQVSIDQVSGSGFRKLLRMKVYGGLFIINYTLEKQLVTSLGNKRHAFLTNGR